MFQFRGRDISRPYFVSTRDFTFHQLAAVTASAPAVPFVGPAVLADVFGGTSTIPIAIASLVINLTVVPVTILFLALVDKESQEVEPQLHAFSALSGKIESLTSALDKEILR
jgi:hypothetical protein